jgi:hypothetical protein
MMLRTLPFLLFTLCSAFGCANYEYNLTDPPDLARHIGKSDQTIPLDPLAYHFITDSNHLVIRIENPMDTPVELLGDQSVVVSPDGQSHPLRSQTIAPYSFAKLIFPPLRPRFENTGPTFGIGVGAVHHVRYPAYPDFPTPRYLYLYDDETYYWDWEGETAIRLTVVYRHQGKTFEHRFAFVRKKM